MPARARDLPDTLTLPLRSGEEWWYWLGGRPALDLVNTLRERWHRRVETLVSPADLRLLLGLADACDRPSLRIAGGAPGRREGEPRHAARAAAAEIARDAARMLGRTHAA